MQPTAQAVGREWDVTQPQRGKRTATTQTPEGRPTSHADSLSPEASLRRATDFSTSSGGSPNSIHRPRAVKPRCEKRQSCSSPWNLPSDWTFRLSSGFGLNDNSHRLLLRWGVSHEFTGFGELVRHLLGGRE